MAKPVASRGTDQFVVRFPDGMRDKIKVIADREGRSMNSQIILMLDQYVNDYEAHTNPEKFYPEVPEVYVDERDELFDKALEKIHSRMSEAVARVFKEIYSGRKFSGVVLEQPEENPSPKDNETDTKEE